MDYDTLIAPKTTPGSIRAWVSYNEVDGPLVLADAQAYIYQRLRVREMRALASGSLLAGVETFALPTGFLDPVVLQIRVPQAVVKLVNEKALLIERRTYDETGLIPGQPSCYTPMGQLGYLDTQTDDAYDWDMIYFKSPPLLTSGAGGTNFLTDRYPTILRHATIGFACMSMQDDNEASASLKLADALIEDVRMMDDLSRRGQEP